MANYLISRHRANLDREDWENIGWSLAITALAGVVTGAVELGFIALQRKLWPDAPLIGAHGLFGDGEEGMGQPVIYQLQVGNGMALVAVPAEQIGFETPDDGDGEADGDEGEAEASSDAAESAE